MSDDNVINSIPNVRNGMESIGHIKTNLGI